MEEQEDKLRETVRELTYLGDSESTSRGYEAAVTALTRCGGDNLKDIAR